MAKRKRSHHKRHARRVGAASLNPNNPLIMLAAVGVGYMAGDKIYSAIDKVIPTTTTAATATTPAVVKNVVSDTVLGGGFAAVGAFLMLKGRKTLVKTAAGGIMAGAGLKWILKDQGVISGFASVPIVAGRRMGGYQGVPVIAGGLGKIPNALTGGYTSSRMPSFAAMGKIPTALSGGYPSSRTAQASALINGMHF